MYIHIDESILNREIKALASEMNNYDTNLNEMKRIVDSFANIWAGAEYNNFNQKFQSFYTELKEMSTSLETYKEFLNGYISACNSLDNTYGAKNIPIK